MCAWAGDRSVDVGEQGQSPRLAKSRLTALAGHGRVCAQAEEAKSFGASEFVSLRSPAMKRCVFSVRSPTHKCGAVCAGESTSF
jgi:hypothetical protein